MMTLLITTKKHIITILTTLFKSKSQSILLYLTLYVLTFLLITSCSHFFKLDQEKQIFQIIPKKNNPTYCPEEKQNIISLFSSNRKAMEDFIPFLQRLSKKRQVSFIEQSVLWTLMQINLRPDLASPTASLKVLLLYNDKQYYFDFTTNQTHNKYFPLLFGLESILQHFKRPFTLLDLAYLLDRHFKSNIFIDKTFASFLNANQHKLQSYPIFKKCYFKADQVLTSGESIPKISFSKTIRTYLKQRKKSHYTISQKLYPYKGTKPFEIKCNLKFVPNQKLHDSTINYVNAHPFGIQDKNNNSFLAVTSQSFKQIKPSLNNFFIEGIPSPSSETLCFFNNPPSGKKISVVSVHGKANHQQIEHLVNNNILAANSLKNIDVVLNSPRHLYLFNPQRILFESSSNNQKELTNFLALDTPIYHSNSIGHLVIHGTLSNKSIDGFVLDSRHSYFLFCK